MALNFPAKIYQILENESSDIIKWLPNGVAFRIVDHGRFEREIIPKYFRHNQLSSVQRQLNLYGFKCISRGEDKGAFYHSKFRRGDWEVVKKITRYAPIKRADDKNDDPTRPDDLILALDTQSPTPAPAPAQTSSSSSSSAPRPAENSNYHSHMSPPFQPYPNVYRHYDPFGFGDLSYRQPPHSTESSSHTSMYQNSPPPPAWMWGGPSAMPYAASPYAMHMKQMIESTPEFREFQQMKQDAASKTSAAQTSQTASSQSSTISEKSVSVAVPQPAKAPEPSLPVNPPVPVVSAPVPELKKTTSFTHIDKPSAYVNVVNDSVFIDPDFDLDEEFYFLHELNDNASVPVHNQSKAVSETQGPKTCDVGVNTDISLLWNYNDL